MREATAGERRGRPRERVPPTPVPVPPSRPLHIVMVGWEWPPHLSGGLGVHCYEMSKELVRLGHRVTFLTPFAGPFTFLEGVTIRYPGDRKARTEIRRRVRPGAVVPERAVAPPAEGPPPAYWEGDSPRSEGTPGAAPGPAPGPAGEEIAEVFVRSTETYNEWVAARGDLDAVDVVHVHDWFGTEGADRLAARLHRPLLMTVHSTEYDRSLGHPWGPILIREELGVRAAMMVIAVSRHLRAQLVERYRADPEKVRVVYNAVRPSERLARIEPTKRVVLYVGRLAAMKGVDTFLRAAARVAPIAPDALFVIAGEGPEYPNLVELAARLGVGERVMFLGKVTDEEREVLLSGASVFVLPSVVEPFGIAALEAMAAGVPTIVSKTSGVAEISSSTFRVDFWDVDEFASRIAEILEYPALRATMGAAGRWEALRKGWPDRARETVAVYHEAIARARSGSRG